ncbi:MAG: iron ABC transporter permease [Deltaproteobacteria bacterium]|nr:iron ABC transporter permease [Deltaproteobacteria bacterium]MBW2071532.1 iron ABC transporter permease [Deltaproteobacteria bacterium]
MHIISEKLGEIRRLTREPLVFSLVIFCFIMLVWFVLYPLYSVFRQSALDENGLFIGLNNYLHFFTNPYFRNVLYNTLYISIFATVGALFVGTLFGYALTRSTVPLKPLFMVTAILPMITPPFVNAFAFILLLGRVGLINIYLQKFFHFKFIIYGWHGVVISQIITTFPLAFLVTSASFSSFDRSLEDSAQDLGARDFRVFRTITLPLITPALMAATLLIFMTNLSAFGAPALLGGGLSVLAVEAVMQTLGVMDWGMGTTISIILLIPSFVLFYLQSVYKSKRSYVTVTGAPAHADVRPTPPKIKWPLFAFLAFMSVIVLVQYLVIFAGGFAKVWGVDNSFTLDHYRLLLENAGRSVINSLWMSSVGALGAALVGVVIAYLIERQNFAGRKAMDFVAMLPYAVPGTMMGLGFVVAFNRPPLILTGTALIIIVDYVIRRMPFGLRTGVSTLKQIDVVLEEASADLGATWFTTFRRVVLPLLKPAFIAGLTFAFIRAITELTSTIFLVTPKWRVMAVDIYNFVEAGSLGVAAAMSSLLMAMVILLLVLLYKLTGATASMFRM